MCAIIASMSKEGLTLGGDFPFPSRHGLKKEIERGRDAKRAGLPAWTAWSEILKAVSQDFFERVASLGIPPRKIPEE